MAELRQLHSHLPHEDRLRILADDGPAERIHCHLDESPGRAAVGGYLSRIRILQQSPGLAEHPRHAGAGCRNPGSLRRRKVEDTILDVHPEGLEAPPLQLSVSSEDEVHPYGLSSPCFLLSRRGRSRAARSPRRGDYAMGEVRDGLCAAICARGAVVSDVHYRNAVSAVCDDI